MRPIFLAGRVAVDDGSPLPERATIERVCGGRALREAQTDTSGNFSFEVGRETRIFQDASTDSSPGDVFRGAGAPTYGTPQSGISERDLLNCELRASLPGFRSDSLMLTRETFMQPHNVGTIVLHRMGKIDGTTISATTLQAPKPAKKALERARKALGKQNLPEAEQQLQEAVQLYPQYAQAWVELGGLFRKMGRNAEAEVALKRALDADPKFLPGYIQLAILAGQNREWQQLADLTDKALALDAFSYPGLYFYNSIAYFNLQKFDRAEGSARSAQRLDSQHRIPRIELVLSQILQQRQDYAGAAEQLRSFLSYAPNDSEAARVRAELAEIESKLPAKKPQ